jgi:hypothetical protein
MPKRKSKQRRKLPIDYGITKGKFHAILAKAAQPIKKEGTNESDPKQA